QCLHDYYPPTPPPVSRPHRPKRKANRSNPRPAHRADAKASQSLLIVPAKARGQDALAGVILSDTPDNFLILRLDPPTADLAVDDAANQGVEAGDEVAIDGGRGVRIADAAVVGEEKIARLGHGRHRAHGIFGLVGNARGCNGRDVDTLRACRLRRGPGPG